MFVFNIIDAFYDKCFSRIFCVKNFVEIILNYLNETNFTVKFNIDVDCKGNCNCNEQQNFNLKYKYLFVMIRFDSKESCIQNQEKMADLVTQKEKRYWYYNGGDHTKEKGHSEYWDKILKDNVSLVLSFSEINSKLDDFIIENSYSILTHKEIQDNICSWKLSNFNYLKEISYNKVTSFQVNHLHRVFFYTIKFQGESLN